MTSLFTLNFLKRHQYCTNSLVQFDLHTLSFLRRWPENLLNSQLSQGWPQTHLKAENCKTISLRIWCLLTDVQFLTSWLQLTLKKSVLLKSHIQEFNDLVENIIQSREALVPISLMNLTGLQQVIVVKGRARSKTEFYQSKVLSLAGGFFRFGRKFSCSGWSCPSKFCGRIFMLDKAFG